jgi:hypothetical protein
MLSGRISLFTRHANFEMVSGQNRNVCRNACDEETEPACRVVPKEVPGGRVQVLRHVWSVVVGQEQQSSTRR